jgi:hypothetical protein
MAPETRDSMMYFFISNIRFIGIKIGILVKLSKFGGPEGRDLGRG